MLFKRPFLEGIADGRITLAFRRWRRASVRPGGRLRTPVGVLLVEAVDMTSPAAITEAEAQQAGYPSRARLIDALGDRAGDLYRISLSFGGADPRLALRERGVLDAPERAALARRLDRLDAASRTGPWTATVLRLIADRPAVRAADLAASIGLATLPFKRQVRKLKELGLTEGLEIGYRLSPRGRAFLDGCGA